MSVGSHSAGGDALDCFVDGVEPPFGFVGAGHFKCIIAYSMTLGLCCDNMRVGQIG